MDQVEQSEEVEDSGMFFEDFIEMHKVTLESEFLRMFKSMEEKFRNARPDFYEKGLDYQKLYWSLALPTSMVWMINEFSIVTPNTPLEIVERFSKLAHAMENVAAIVADQKVINQGIEILMEADAKEKP